MQFSWTGFREYIINIWNKLNTPQKFVLVAAPLIVATALVMLISWANKPQFVPIFTNLSTTEAGAIKNKLQELKVNYELADNGGTIMVPKQQVSEVRLDLANSGLPQGSKFSFDSLDQIHLGETDADRKLRFILGLQNELETTLKTLEGVQDARVHITIPEPSLFTENEKVATAAVTLKLIPGAKIEENHIRAVANLVASSVENLKPENITIVDTDGNVLSDLIGKSNDPRRLTGTQLQLQQAFEGDMEKSVQSMLDRVFGPGNIVVRTNAELDFDQRKIVTQKKGPGTLISRQTLSENVYNGSQAGITGQNSIQSGVQGYVTPPPNNNTSVSSKNESTENYEVDNTQEERFVTPGAVKRLSVSVLADSDVIAKNQIEDIKAIVASAVGYDESRGDQIQVAAVPFNKEGIKEQKEALAAAERDKTIQTYVKLGVAALLALIFLLVILFTRKSKKKVYEEDFEPFHLETAEDMEMAIKRAQQEAAASELPQISPEAEKKNKVKESVESFSKNNPEVVAKLMKAWLMEDK